jgi:hypothetical protein
MLEIMIQLQAVNENCTPVLLYFACTRVAFEVGILIHLRPPSGCPPLDILSDLS